MPTYEHDRGEDRHSNIHTDLTFRLGGEPRSVEVTRQPGSDDTGDAESGPMGDGERPCYVVRVLEEAYTPNPSVYNAKEVGVFDADTVDEMLAIIQREAPDLIEDAEDAGRVKLLLTIFAEAWLRMERLTDDQVDPQDHYLLNIESGDQFILGPYPSDAVRLAKAQRLHADDPDQDYFRLDVPTGVKFELTSFAGHEMETDHPDDAHACQCEDGRTPPTGVRDFSHPSPFPRLPEGWHVVERCEACRLFPGDEEAAQSLYDEVRTLTPTESGTGFNYTIVRTASRKANDEAIDPDSTGPCPPDRRIRINPNPAPTAAQVRRITPGPWVVTTNSLVDGHIMIQQDGSVHQDPEDVAELVGCTPEDGHFLAAVLSSVPPHGWISEQDTNDAADAGPHGRIN